MGWGRVGGMDACTEGRRDGRATTSNVSRGRPMYSTEGANEQSPLSTTWFGGPRAVHTRVPTLQAGVRQIFGIGEPLLHIHIAASLREWRRGRGSSESPLHRALPNSSCQRAPRAAHTGSHAAAEAARSGRQFEPPEPPGGRADRRTSFARAHARGQRRPLPGAVCERRAPQTPLGTSAPSGSPAQAAGAPVLDYGRRGARGRQLSKRQAVLCWPTPTPYSHTSTSGSMCATCPGARHSASLRAPRQYY